MFISTCCFFSKKLKMSRDIFSYRFAKRKKRAKNMQIFLFSLFYFYFSFVKTWTFFWGV